EATLRGSDERTRVGRWTKKSASVKRRKDLGRTCGGLRAHGPDAKRTMRDEWVLGLIAMAAAAGAGACSQNNTNVAISAGGFAGPILDYDLALDTAMWDDTSENTIPRPLGALLDSWAAVVDPTCVPNVPFVDADQDRVPATYSATFNCLDQMSAG